MPGIDRERLAGALALGGYSFLAGLVCGELLDAGGLARLLDLRLAVNRLVSLRVQRRRRDEKDVSAQRVSGRDANPRSVASHGCVAIPRNTQPQHRVGVGNTVNLHDCCRRATCPGAISPNLKQNAERLRK